MWFYLTVWHAVFFYYFFFYLLVLFCKELKEDPDQRKEKNMIELTANITIII